MTLSPTSSRGSSGGAISPVFQQFESNDYTTVSADNTYLPWNSQVGSGVLDVTNPFAPVTVVDGLYTFAVVVYAGQQAEKWFYAYLESTAFYSNPPATIYLDSTGPRQLIAAPVILPAATVVRLRCDLGDSGTVSVSNVWLDAWVSVIPT